MMTPDLFNGNIYLIGLRLSRCGLDQLSLSHVTFLNLQSLDLSDNLFGTLQTSSLLRLKNLRELKLARNPLTEVTTSGNNDFSPQIRSLDVSHAYFDVLNATAFLPFKKLNSLNLSGSPVIDVAGFFDNVGLKILDLRDTSIQNVPRNFFKSLIQLQVLYVDNYKLCCSDNLPEHFNTLNCMAPKDAISTCASLIGSDSYRTSVWLMALVSIIANIANVVYLGHCQRKFPVSASASMTMLIQLSVSDACTCVYLLVIGAVDVMYSGEYFNRDHQWRSSVTCSMAGVLFVLSEHVSTLIALTLTLERVSFLRDQTHRRLCGGRASVALYSLLWTAGTSVAVAPLLPGLFDQGLYGSTALCAPVWTSSIHTIPSHQIFLGAQLSFQLLLQLATLLVLSYVRWSSRLVAASEDVAYSRFQDVLWTNRVSVLVIVDTFCSLAVALPGWLAVVVTDSVPDDVALGVHLFVKPLNVALNPLLCLYSLFRESRDRRLAEAALRRV